MCFRCLGFPGCCRMCFRCRVFPGCCRMCFRCRGFPGCCRMCFRCLGFPGCCRMCFRCLGFPGCCRMSFHCLGFPGCCRRHFRCCRHLLRFLAPGFPSVIYCLMEINYPAGLWYQNSLIFHLTFSVSLSSHNPDFPQSISFGPLTGWFLPLLFRPVLLMW